MNEQLTPNQIKEIQNSKQESYQDYVTRQQQKGKQAKRQKIDHVKNLYAEYYKNNKSLPPHPRLKDELDDETRLKEAEYKLLYGKSYILEKARKERIQRKKKEKKRKQDKENDIILFSVVGFVALMVLL